MIVHTTSTLQCSQVFVIYFYTAQPEETTKPCAGDGTLPGAAVLWRPLKGPKTRTENQQGTEGKWQVAAKALLVDGSFGSIIYPRCIGHDHIPQAEDPNELTESLEHCSVGGFSRLAAWPKIVWNVFHFPSRHHKPYDPNTSREASETQKHTPSEGIWIHREHTSSLGAYPIQPQHHDGQFPKPFRLRGAPFGGTLLKTARNEQAMSTNVEISPARSRA